MKKSIAIQGVAFLISLSGSKEGKVMGEAGNCQFLSNPSTGGISPQCRAQYNWQLSFGRGTQAGHFSLS